MPESELAAAAAQEGPSLDTKVFNEAHLLNEERSRGVEVPDCKYECRRDDFRHGLNLLDA
jgi:hypothetical protein